jgi:hypothetical protein
MFCGVSNETGGHPGGRYYILYCAGMLELYALQVCWGSTCVLKLQVPVLIRGGGHYTEGAIARFGGIPHSTR